MLNIALDSNCTESMLYNLNISKICQQIPETKHIEILSKDTMNQMLLN